MSNTGAQLSFTAFSQSYAPRRPEESVLYKAVAKNLRSFESYVEMSDKKLPSHITEEFDAFLKCGILAHGFLRLKCTNCKTERLLAFSSRASVHSPLRVASLCNFAFLQNCRDQDFGG
jgi:hypothetical protein